MISANDLKNGVVIKVDNELYTVIGFQHTKPGKGPAYMKMKLKHLTKANVTEKTFRALEKVENIYVERKTMQYLYKSDNEYIFMDKQDYEQITISGDYLDDSEQLMKEGMDIEVQLYQGKLIAVVLPTFVELKVIETEPGVKGDTVTGAMKPAKLETGLNIRVPLFINEGDVIKVDTRDHSYNERA